MTAPQPSLHQSSGAKYTRIFSLGVARGSQIVTNDEIAGPINSSDEWIRQRTGIETRTRATDDVDALDLASEAAKDCLAQTNVEASQIDLVIVATLSNIQQSPSMAAVVADRIGANPAAAYDINAACAGYVYATIQADALIRSGAATYALVIGAEKLSNYIDPTDRSISFLLGDGAGAAVIGPSEICGISSSVWGSDGSQSERVGMNSTLIDFRDARSAWPTLRQDGPSVFRWAVWQMRKVAKAALVKAGITADDLDAFIPHQANMRIIDEFAKQLKLSPDVLIARDIRTTGNTSAASIPLATHQLLQENPKLSGGLALQIGFGAGLVFAAQVVILP